MLQEVLVFSAAIAVLIVLGVVAQATRRWSQRRARSSVVPPVIGPHDPPYERVVGE